MIKQYALEPAAVLGWLRFNLVFSHIGCEKGRLIADDTLSWSAQVWHFLKESGLGDSEKNRILESMMLRERFRKNFVSRTDFRTELNQDWLTHAISAHHRKHFAAIISKQKYPVEPSIVMVDDLNDDNQQWRVERSRRVLRSAEAIADLVAPLIRISKHIAMIDPYFLQTDSDYHRKRWLSPLKAMLDCHRDPSVVWEYHTSDRNGFIPESKYYKKYIKPLFNAGQSLTIVHWPQRDMHNRFILTDRGGIAFGHGLDEGAGKDPGFDDVSLMDEAHWKKTWEYHKYTKKNRMVIT